MLLYAGFSLVLLICLVAYVVYLWKIKSPPSPFQAKMTGLFLLFVLLPSLPLVFLSAFMFNQSLDLLLQPGIQASLETSIHTIRGQMEEKGRAFFRIHTDTDSWSSSLLRDNRILWAGEFTCGQNGWIKTKTVATRPFPFFESWHPPLSQEKIRGSHIIEWNGNYYLVCYQDNAPESILAAGYELSAEQYRAKQTINRTLAITNSLVYIKDSILHRNLIWTAAVLIIGMLTILSVLSSSRLAWEINRPIHDLVTGMKQVAQGDLSQPVVSAARNEFRFLVDSFNTMMADLKVNREKRIQAERIAAWQGMARRMSHEIKNSLTPISLSLRQIRNRLPGEAVTGHIKDSLAVMDDELKSLQEMAAAFSRFSRLPEMQKHPMDLNSAVRAVTALLAPAAPRISFDLDLSSALPEISGDLEQIKRMLNNVLQNAVQASEPGSRIEVHTRPAADHNHPVEIEIRDFGHGMNADVAEKIFQPYFTTKSRGTGLGLAIVQKIIEQHGGEISVKSSPEQGTRVIIRL